MNSAKTIALALTVLLQLPAFAHPDKVEDRLVLHFATGAHPPANGRWEDLTHQYSAEVKGAPTLTNIGPALAVVFDGAADHLRVTNVTDRLPRTEFTVAAWVLLKDTHPDGGIVGCALDTGGAEKGFVLGYDGRGVFSFWIAAQGADDGDGKLTRIRARAPSALGRWHHVAGTYDGKTMRLYVNGQEEANSIAQSGPLLYPAQSPLAIGAYVDDNEFHPLDGAIYEVKLYSRVLAAAELAAVAQKNQALVDYTSPVNTKLRFIVAPYLQFATMDSVVVMCETSAAANMTVEYAEHHPLTQRASSSASSLINSVRLTGLRTATPYFYRVTCTDDAGNIAQSDVFTFQTAPDAKAAWAFGILGDTQRNPDVTRKCAEGIFALRPNFMLHCGDVVDDGFAKHQWVSDLFEPCSKLFAHVPTFPVIGNHEKNSHWYYDYFHLLQPEYFYTFHYGNAQFFMIDSNKDLSPGSEQYQWLERELKKSTATWKFTCHHHPCFSSDENDYGDRWKGKAPEGYVWGDKNAMKLVELYERYGVDIAFAGHIHSYERTWPILQMAINQKNGVRYIVSGGGGGGLEQAGPQRAWFTLHVQRGHHYCFATVQDRTIQFKAYDLEGRLFDTFELTKGSD